MIGKKYQCLRCGRQSTGGVACLWPGCGVQHTNTYPRKPIPAQTTSWPAPPDAAWLERGTWWTGPPCQACDLGDFDKDCTCGADDAVEAGKRRGRPGTGWDWMR